MAGAGFQDALDPAAGVLGVEQANRHIDQQRPLLREVRSPSTAAPPGAMGQPISRLGKVRLT